jgi:hypothetical protein
MLFSHAGHGTWQAGFQVEAMEIYLYVCNLVLRQIRLGRRVEE